MSLTAARHETADPAGAGRLRIAVYDAVADAAPAWRTLQSSAPASPYQAYAWIEAWCTSSLASGIKPAIAVVYDEADVPLALLPFGRTRRAGLTIGRFLGGKDSNCNMGLLSERLVWSTDLVRPLIEDIGHAASFDLLVLQNQPLSWHGRANPLLALGAQPSPSNARSTAVHAGPEQHLERTLSKHARKNLRQKDGKLRQQGPVAHRRATTAAEVDRFVEAYIRLKSARFDAMGVTALAEPEGFASFLAAVATQPPASPPVELHALTCGDDILAVLGGATDGRHFAAMVLAFDGRPEVARCSPGDLLVAAVIADLCRRGFTGFDLGIGDARYKETFCPDVDPRFDSFIALTARGRLAARALAARGNLKGVLKRSPLAWSLIRKARRLRAHLATG